MTLTDTIGVFNYISKKNNTCPFDGETFEKSYDLFDHLEKFHTQEMNSIVDVYKNEFGDETLSANVSGDKDDDEEESEDIDEKTEINHFPYIGEKEPDSGKVAWATSRHLPEGAEEGENYEDVSAGIFPEAKTTEETAYFIASKAKVTRDGDYKCPMCHYVAPSIYTLAGHLVDEHLPYVNRIFEKEFEVVDDGEEEEERDKQYENVIEGETYKGRRGRGVNGPQAYAKRVRAYFKGVQRKGEVSWNEQYRVEITKPDDTKMEATMVTHHQLYNKEVYDSETKEKYYYVTCKYDNLTHFPVEGDDVESQRTISVLLRSAMQMTKYGNWTEPRGEWNEVYDLTMERYNNDKEKYNKMVQEEAIEFANRYINRATGEYDEDENVKLPETLNPANLKTEEEKEKDRVLGKLRRQYEIARSKKLRSESIGTAASQKLPFKLIGEDGKVRFVYPDSPEYKEYERAANEKINAEHPITNTKYKEEQRALRSLERRETRERNKRRAKEYEESERARQNKTKKSIPRERLENVKFRVESDDKMRHSKEPFKLVDETGKVRVIYPDSPEYDEYEKLEAEKNKTKKGVVGVRVLSSDNEYVWVSKFNYERDVDETIKELVDRQEYRGTIGLEYKCPFDSAVFINKNGLAYHLLTKHTNELDDIIDDYEY